MAEGAQDSENREFDATEQKRRKARMDGDVAQSKELNAFALLSGLIAILAAHTFLGGALFDALVAFLHHSQAFAGSDFNDGALALNNQVRLILLVSAPVFLVLSVFTLLSIAAQRSLTFSPRKIKIDIKKIDTVTKFGKKYGPTGHIEFFMSLVKMVFASLIGAYVVYKYAIEYYGMYYVNISSIYDVTYSAVFDLILMYAVFQIGLAFIDMPLQGNRLAKRLKMTREEVKRELKESEGDPHLKQARRDRALKAAQGGMLDNVESATVVMVNPEHYAVALAWTPEGDRAPVCVAKGVDHLAAKIRDLAAEHAVPVYRDPATTRSIYRLVEVDEEIKPQHFAAVAAAIQFVDRVRHRRSGDRDA